MKKGNLALKVIFGGMGAFYAVIGLICLAMTTDKAERLIRIFAQPGNNLSLSIVGGTFAALGVVFLGVGIAFVLADRRRARLREELLACGQRVQGTIVEVRTNHAIRVNRENPVIAVVCCQLPGGEARLKSHNLWRVRPAVGDVVEVLCDPMDEKRYVIEFPDEK